MSVGRLAKTQTEQFRDAWLKYQEEFPGSFRVETFVDWGVGLGLLDDPKINPRTILVRNAKRAMRSSKFTDAQGRKNVREMIPVKVPTRVDARGNRVFEVFWDHIYKMSADHALNAFQQADENIEKQKRAATRNVLSFLDNNPNGKGLDGQFEFSFMVDEPTTQVVEVIPESPKPSDHESGDPRKPR